MQPDPHVPHAARLSPGPGSWGRGTRSPATLALACLLGRCLHRREDSLLLAFLILGRREKGMQQGPEDVLWTVVSFAPNQPSELRGSHECGRAPVPIGWLGEGPCVLPVPWRGGGPSRGPHALRGQAKSHPRCPLRNWSSPGVLGPDGTVQWRGGPVEASQWRCRPDPQEAGVERKANRAPSFSQRILKWGVPGGSPHLSQEG